MKENLHKLNLLSSSTSFNSQLSDGDKTIISLLSSSNAIYKEEKNYED